MAHCLSDSDARFGQQRTAGTRFFGERQEQTTLRDTAVHCGINGGAGFICSPSVVAAPPEQDEMAGRSIQASIQRRNAGGQQFDLSMGYRPWLYPEFP